MSETPRCDAFGDEPYKGDNARLVLLWIRFAESLERDLTQAKAELAAVRADAERLDAIEKNMWFVEPDYSLLTPVFRVGKVNEKTGKLEHAGRRLRDAIDSAREQQAERRGE